MANVYANADYGPLQSAAPVKTTPTTKFIIHYIIIYGIA